MIRLLDLHSAGFVLTTKGGVHGKAVLPILDLYLLKSSGELAAVTDVHAFAYRAPRFPLVVPVEFCIAGSPIPGHTRDLSDKGSLVHLSQPVLPGTLGRLRVKIDTCLIELAAEVAYAELYEVGLRFQFASHAEQSFVETLVRVVARNKLLRI